MTRFMLAVAAAVGIVLTAQAGGPPPVYVVVDEVVVEPCEKSPERVTIRGVFARLKDGKGAEYTTPVEGSVHFTLPREKAKEWEKELKAWQNAAGTGKVVPVGMCDDAGTFLKVAIRKPDERPKTADETYTPGHVGATDETNGKQTWADMEPVRDLQKFIKERKAKAEKGKEAKKGDKVAPPEKK